MPGNKLTDSFVGIEGTLWIATQISLHILKTPEAIFVLLSDCTDIISAGIEIIIMNNLYINTVERWISH